MTDTAHLLSEAAHVESAARRARVRAELVATWLQLVIETHHGEASIELRKGATVTPLIRKVGTDDPDEWRHALHGDGDQ